MNESGGNFVSTTLVFPEAVRSDSPERIARALEIKKITNIQQYMAKDIDRNFELPTEVLAMIEREYKGGYCPKCHKEWHRVSVKNKHADFVYFLPVCKCFPVCMHCANHYQKRHLPRQLASLHRVAILGPVTECPNCGKNPFDNSNPKPVENKEKHWYGKN